MKIKKGDQVFIISGKNRAKRGKVLEVFLKQKRIIIEGINLRKKHVKPRKTGEKGQIIEMPASIHISNIKLVCPKCAKAVRVGYRIEAQKKYRVCKKCSQEI